MLAALLVAMVAVASVGLAAGVYRSVRRRKVAAALRIASPPGVVEEGFVRLGGIEQWVGVRGEDRSNPVLLVIHGGPGSCYSVLTPLVRAWEKHFNVVQWDMRGAGKTLGRTGKQGSGEMSFARMVDDGIELVEHLRARLGHEKIVLLSSSMGTLVGLPMIKRRPDLFCALVATDLNVGVMRNHPSSYARALEHLREVGDDRAVAALQRIGSDPKRWDVRAWNILNRCTLKTVVVGPGVDEVFFPRALLSPNHSLRDVMHLISGIAFSTARLFNQFIAFDARQLGMRFEVPFFVFQGEADPFTLPALAREYFDDVEAPTKRFALIKNAGHLPAFTQPEQFLDELLTDVRPLAVKPARSEPRPIAPDTPATTPRKPSAASMRTRP